jgi:hypothetical protein
MGIQQMGESLKAINPAGKNPGGNCVAFARQAAEALTLGHDPEAPAPGTAPALSDGKHELIKEFDDDADPDKIWGWLFKKVPPNHVVVLSDDDHTWNVVRGGKGQLFLVDTSAGCFKPINSAADCSIPEDEGGESNPLESIEDGLSIYLWGPLHPRWQKVLGDE